MAKAVTNSKTTATKSSKSAVTATSQKADAKETASKKSAAQAEEKISKKKTDTVSEQIPAESKTEKPAQKSKSSSDEKLDVTVEKKLVALLNLQLIDTEINKIRIVRGELPLEVQDLEDEIEGLETRLENYNAEISEIELSIKEKKTAIKDCQALIKKYESQQSNVRNNREFDSLTKEIEYQTLEIQLCEKRIKEFTVGLDAKKELIAKTKQVLKERNEDLNIKQQELEEIVTETEKEEARLLKKLQENQKMIEDRLLNAYQRIKKNARNGLAVVVVERDACGGCFNKIPPQRQLDIKIHKKIIVCEYCGRILVDKTIEEMVKE
jgi:uncharacterized protein